MYYTNTIDRGAVLAMAVATYGQVAQEDMMIEEMSELTKAICKLKRATSAEAAKAADDAIIEEMADVQIMLDQMRLIFGSTAEAEGKKLERLQARLTIAGEYRKEGQNGTLDN